MKWNKKDAPVEKVKELASTYGCDLITASILIRRGLTSPEDLLFYLENDKRYLHNPFLLPGMEDAVERVIAAKEEGEKILVFGDRDTDGITSIALLAGFLSRNGADVSWRLPHGDEPYGLSLEAVETFAKDNGTLIITVDCGISNHNEIKRANELNIDVIVTDHHKPHDMIPEAYAVVNPKIKTNGAYAYPFQELAGCGVAYKFIRALRFAMNSEFYGHSICFMNAVPAKGETWAVEVIKTRNLNIIDRLVEVIMPGTISVTGTRLPAFLEGQRIFVYDAPAQKKALKIIFGRGVEFGLFDCAPLIAGAIPQTEGKSLIRLKEASRIARYSSPPLTEIDVLFNLFVSFVTRTEKSNTREDDEDVQLAAVGTIADLMPLHNENRILVRYGVNSLRTNARPGLSDLMFRLNLLSRNLSSTDVSWQLTPVINSAGRLGEADIPVRLLLAKDPSEREKLTGRIMELNNARRALADDTWNEKISKRAEENKDRFAGKFIFADGDDIKRGVTGVMANRLTNVYHVPALIIAYNGNLATGSMRSTRGYDLQGILELGKDLFIDSGGHDYAAGFSLETSKAGEFLKRVEDFAPQIVLNDETDIIEIDAELPLQYLTPEIFKVTDRLEPFGKGNKDINFLANNMIVSDITFVGRPDSKHIKLILDTGEYKWPALYWGAADKVGVEFNSGDKINAIFSVCRNYFNGRETPQMRIIDLEKSG